MLTCCPACATTFRITPEQLKAKLGRVRCGHCASVFNALESLVEETGSAGLAPHHDTERESDEAETIHLSFDLSASEAKAVAEVDTLESSHRPVPEALVSADPAPQDDDATEDVADSALQTESQPEAQVEVSSGQTHERLERAFLPFQGGGQEGDGVASDSDELYPGTSAPHPHPGPPLEGEGEEWIASRTLYVEPMDEADARLEEVPTVPVDDVTDDTSNDEAGNEADAEAEVESASPLQSEPEQEPEPEFDSADTTATDEPPTLVAADVLPPPPAFLDLIAPTHPRRWPWVIGVTLALVVLVLQLALVYRVELAVMLPEAKPLLTELCQPLACRIDLPARPELLSIDASDLHPGKDKGQLQLIATLKNRAPFVQGYPNLEVTLTDLADRPLIVRSLKPADYLPPGSQVDAGFAPRADLAVSLDLEVGDVPAVGYRLYLYYP